MSTHTPASPLILWKGHQSIQSIFFFLVNISTIMTFITSPEHFLKVEYLMAFLTPLVQLKKDAKCHKSIKYSEQQLAISTVLKVVSFRFKFWMSVLLSFCSTGTRDHWGSQLHSTPVTLRTSHLTSLRATPPLQNRLITQLLR